MSMEELRLEIDKADEKIVSAFINRMETSSKIALYKKENDLPVFDPKREREKLTYIAEKTPEEIRDYTRLLYSLIFEMSRSYQNRVIKAETALCDKISNSIKNTPQLFPETAVVACQGVDGANSQIACNKLFKNANIMFFSGFEAVFSAVEKGLCKYGVIPVENSNAGSVNSVYDLMMSHNFYITRSIRLKVDHNLLAKKGVKISDIKEIYSHEQAISQCSKYLKTFSGVKIIACENTAAAAKAVAESGRNDIAAIAAFDCTKYYPLECLKKNIQNSDNNYTRFICISKELEIYPGADRTSLMMTLPHEQGSLYKILARFYALGINLNKLESRPIPGKDFEFMFYFDLDTSVYSPRFLQLMGELPQSSESFNYLGSYNEVI